MYLTRLGGKNSGEIIYANPAAALQTGYKINKLIGMNIITDFGSEKNKEKLKKSRESDLNKDKNISFNEKKKRADDTEYWTQVMITTIDYENEKVTLSVNSDITKQIEAQEGLKNSERRYRALFEKNLAGVYTSTVGGKILDCNNAVVKMFGYKSKNELLIKNTNDLYNIKRERKIFIEKLKKEGSLKNYEITIKKKDGTIINILKNASIISDNIIQCNLIDITNIKKYEKNLQELLRKNQILSASLLKAQEIEKRKISMELHDEIGQALTAININLELIENEKQSPLSKKAKEHIRVCKEILEKTLKEVQDISLNLRPLLLDELGLISALSWLISEFIEKNDFKVNFKSPKFEERLTPNVELLLYRIVQEALTNIARHSKAKNVNLLISKKNKNLKLLIEDDGIGFDFDKALYNLKTGHGIGILSIQERVAELGGEIQFHTKPRKGTKIKIYLSI